MEHSLKNPDQGSYDSFSGYLGKLKYPWPWEVFAIFTPKIKRRNQNDSNG